MNKPAADMNEKAALFDNPRNVRWLLVIFFASVGCLLLVDLVYHRHAIFPWEGWFGFYAVFGFVACVALVLAAKHVLRPIVMRGEDYYDQ
jgi:hypothetical protein